MNHFLHHIGLVPYREPFQRLLVQGMVMGQSFRVKGTGQYLPKENVDFSGELQIPSFHDNPCNTFILAHNKNVQCNLYQD